MKEFVPNGENNYINKDKLSIATEVIANSDKQKNTLKSVKQNNIQKNCIIVGFLPEDFSLERIFAVSVN